MGGVEISIAKKNTTSVKTIPESLMLSAGQLGLQSQEVADIIAFIQQSD